MHWFFLTLIGPLIYALTNHIDKVLLEKYFKSGGVGTLMIFSSVFSIFVLPFLFLVDPHVLQVSYMNMVVLAVVGILNVLVLWFYFLALKDEEVSVAIVFYQLVPVFGYALGYFILHETLTEIQLVAMGIIILGTATVSFEIDRDNRFKLRRQTIVYMLAASFCWALSSVIFKAVALEENVWRSLFWEHCMLLLAGLLLFVFVRNYRTQFLAAVTSNSGMILTLNVTNELLYVLGTFVFSYAYLLAPISLVLLMNSYQPIFVLIIGIVLTVYFPNISVEKIHAKHLWQKSFAIIITIIGTYLLLSTS